jgi:predicted RNA polymerase sigma factor
VLTRKVGVRHIDVVEDAVQGAPLTALTAWTAQGLPDEPGGWLYREANNSVMGDLRRKTDRLRILEQSVDAVARSDDDPSPSYFVNEVADDMLRMLFICCDDAIPRESRIVLALKTLCGFSVSEIALRLNTVSISRRQESRLSGTVRSPRTMSTLPANPLRPDRESSHETGRPRRSTDRRHDDRRFQWSR